MKNILKTRLNILLAIGLLIIVFSILQNYQIVMNHSESLPYHFVIIKKNKIPTKKNEVFVFVVKNDPLLKVKKVNFIKLVGGLPGDLIEIKGGEIFIDGKKTKFSANTNDKETDMFVYHALKYPSQEVEKVKESKKLEIKDLQIYVAGKLIGNIKAYSKKNIPLHPLETKIIPKNKFFAYSPHIDSYDSRYQEIGLIDEKDIIGTAIFAF